MRVGLGTGSTVAYLLRALAVRKLTLRCVSTSPETAAKARAPGLYSSPSTAATRCAGSTWQSTAPTSSPPRAG